MLSLLKYICYLLRTFFEGLYQQFLSYTSSSSTAGSSPQGQVVTFDNNRRVRVGRQIAEGGFSYVFEAFDASSNSSSEHSSSSTTGGGTKKGKRFKYALKRINCPDPELASRCREEAAVHAAFDHPNLLPLLGAKFETRSAAGSTSSSSSSSSGGGMDACYLLFPYLLTSLRDKITQRKLLRDDVPLREKRPWTDRSLLELFSGIVDGVSAMHDGGYSHRDVKLENVLLDEDDVTPVLVDFGSAGPVNVRLDTRADVLHAIETAASHTTVSYRPPELFEGGCRHGPIEHPLDYAKVDVWGLGCVLFGLMYGASPFECEFRNDGNVRVVECNQLRVLGRVPTPPPHTDVSAWYANDIKDLAIWILNADRVDRPNVGMVRDKVEKLVRKFGGGQRRKGAAPFNVHRHRGKDQDQFDSLLADRDFV